MSKIETVAVTEAQASRALSISKAEVRELVLRGELDGRMVGDRIIISTESVRRFVRPEDRVGVEEVKT